MLISPVFKHAPAFSSPMHPFMIHWLAWQVQGSDHEPAAGHVARSGFLTLRSSHSSRDVTYRSHQVSRVCLSFQNRSTSFRRHCPFWPTHTAFVLLMALRDTKRWRPATLIRRNSSKGKRFCHLVLPRNWYGSRTCDDVHRVSSTSDLSLNGRSASST